jgi:hypothetical protein
VNRDEAKNILLLYRPGVADKDDPQIAEALALAENDTELAGWLKAHCARQILFREKLRQITAPPGLKEQIISGQAAQEKIIPLLPRFQFALAAIILLCGLLGIFWFQHRQSPDALAVYKNQMIGVALRGYAMDFPTNNLTAIQSYLSQNHAPADFVLPAPLKQAAAAGCAIEDWQGVKVSMICFHTGKPLVPGAASDLWLFVIDRTAFKKSAADVNAKFARVNRLITVTWIQDGKVYLLGTAGDEAAIKKYL